MCWHDWVEHEDENNEAIYRKCRKCGKCQRAESDGFAQADIPIIKYKWFNCADCEDKKIKTCREPKLSKYVWSDEKGKPIRRDSLLETRET